MLIGKVYSWKEIVCFYIIVFMVGRNMLSIIVSQKRSHYLDVYFIYNLIGVSLINLMVVAVNF